MAFTVLKHLLRRSRELDDADDVPATIIRNLHKAITPDVCYKLYRHAGYL